MANKLLALVAKALQAIDMSTGLTHGTVILQDSLNGIFKGAFTPKLV
jgi:hypothetical protein